MKTPLPEGNLWAFDYHMEKSESFCDVTSGLYAGHRRVHFRRSVWGK